MTDSKKHNSSSMAQLQKIIKPLLNFGDSPEPTVSPSSTASEQEYTIESLATASDLSVRTIRNYQDKGLLDPPKLKGRKGFYSNSHLSRLTLVTNLIERGFTVNVIKELLLAVEQGIGLDEFLGVETAVNTPWSDERPQEILLTELKERFANDNTDNVIQLLEEFGLIKIKDDQVNVRSMESLEIIEKLFAVNIPVNKLIAASAILRSGIEQIAEEFINLASDHLLPPEEDGEENKLPSRDKVVADTALIWELRPLAKKIVSIELDYALGKAANASLADRLAKVLSELSQT